MFARRKKQGCPATLSSKTQSGSTRSQESGFTILESLMAIVVVTILLTGVAPMIVLSVATRVQARRVELGTQAAWRYIDGLRSGQIVPPSHAVVLDLSSTDPNTRNQNRSQFLDNFANVPPPGVNEARNALQTPLCRPNAADPNSIYPYCVNSPTISLYCVDLDQPNPNDPNARPPGCAPHNGEYSFNSFIIQAFRSTTRTDASSPLYSSLDATARQRDAEKGYLVSLRVYRADALRDDTPLQSARNNRPGTANANSNRGKQNPFGTGLNVRKAPLIEISTEVAVQGQESQYSNLCTRLGGCQ